ncbi:MAG: CU044_2847 family protein [Cyanobacteria bacterium J06649_4]
MDEIFPTERISLELEDGRIVQVEVEDTGRSNVSIERRAFKEAMENLEGVIEALTSTINKVRPTKASVKFGVDIGIESGQLTAVIMKGSSKANIEITMEWE